MLVYGPAGTQALADEGKGLVLHPVDELGGPVVLGNLMLIPPGDGQLKEVGGADHLRAERAHQVERPAIHPGNVGELSHGEYSIATVPPARPNDARRAQAVPVLIRA